MKTNYFYEKFISNQCILPELAQVHHHVYFKGRENKYVAVNTEMAEFVGYSPEQIKVLTDKEIVTDPLSYKCLSENDQLIIQSKSTKIFTESATVNNKTANFLSIKAPFYDANETIGVCGISLIIGGENFSDLYSLLGIINNLFQQDVAKNTITSRPAPKLTPRELICLRLYMKGHSAKSIAEILSLSMRTVEYYIDNIKSKFGVNKREQLLPLAFDLYPELVMQ